MNVLEQYWAFLTVSTCLAFTILAQTPENCPVDIVNNYIESVARDSDLDITIVLIREDYYDDGTVKKRDALSFLSNPKRSLALDNFNISTLSKKKVQKLVTDAEDKGVVLSLYQESALEEGEDGAKEMYFGTAELDAPESPAAEVVQNNDFFGGLKAEIADTINQAEDIATVQFLQLHKDGTIKRNRTGTFYVTPISVSQVEKMSNKLVESVLAEVKKAYKVEVDDRAPYIVHLLDKKFPKYYWQVLVNTTAYYMDKDISMILKIGHDEYDIIGNSH